MFSWISGVISMNISGILVISRRCFANDGYEMYKDSKRTCRTIVLLIKTFVWERSGWGRRRGLLKLSSLSYWYEVLSFSTDQKYREMSVENHQHNYFVFSLFDSTFLFWVNSFLPLEEKIVVEPRVIKIGGKKRGQTLTHKSPPTVTRSRQALEVFLRIHHLFSPCLLTLVSSSNLSVFHLRNSEVIYFVWHCPRYHNPKSGKKR